MMFTSRHILLPLFLLVLLLPSCSSKQGTDQTANQTGGYDELENSRQQAEGVTSRAHRAIGTPYVPGGRKPGGFDCSGLVQWAYKGVGITLPRTAAEQSRYGTCVLDRSKMRAGDIVTFRRRDGGYHTGIYLGNNRFIHAPRPNAKVRVDSLDTGYFRDNFLGARRIDMSRGNPAVAARAREAQNTKPPRTQTKAQGTPATRADKDTAGRTAQDKRDTGIRRGTGSNRSQDSDTQTNSGQKAAKQKPGSGHGDTGSQSKDRQKKPTATADTKKTQDPRDSQPDKKPVSQNTKKPAQQKPAQKPAQPAQKKPTQAPLRATANTKPAGPSGTMRAPTATQKKAKDKPSEHKATAGPSTAASRKDMQKPVKEENVQIHVRPSGPRN